MQQQQLHYQRFDQHQHQTMAAVSAAPPQQQQYTYVSPGVLEVTPYSKKCARVLGWLQILAGCACIALELLYLHLAANVTGSCSTVIPAGAGIWSGCLHLLAGIFGVASASLATKCRVVTFMVLSILSSIIALVAFLVAIGVTVAIKVGRREPPSEDDHYDCYYVRGSENPQLALLAVQFVQTVVAITSASVCCRGVCCGRTTAAVNTTTVTAAAPAAVVTHAQVQYPHPQPQPTAGYYFPAGTSGMPAPAAAPPQPNMYPPDMAAAGHYPGAMMPMQGYQPPSGSAQPGPYPKGGNILPSAPAPEDTAGDTRLPSYEEAMGERPT